jgi:hypothetical protein
MAHPQKPGLNIGDVLKVIKQQLDWRGPSGKAQGHIVLTREQAEVLAHLPQLLSLAIDEAGDKIGEVADKLMRS